MFVLSDFLKHLSPEMLEKYCKSTKLDFALPETDDPEKIANAFIEYLGEKAYNTRATVELNFQEVKEIVGEKGSLMLIEEAKTQQILIDNKLDALSNYDKAMWFFLNERDIFDMVALEYEIEHSLGWLPYNVDPIERKKVLGKEHELAAAVRDYYYQMENRGDICQAECVEKENYICYIAYPQDYVDRDISYDKETQKLNKTNHRQPVFKVFFLYHPEENRLSVKVKGSKAKKESLLKIFGKFVLDQELTEDQKVRYDLSVLKNFNLPFDTPPKDKVQQVKLIELRLMYPKAYGKKLVVSVDKNGYGSKDIGNFIRKMDIPLHELNITQAKVYVKFTPTRKREKGTVTATITAPDSCTLGEKKNHDKVRQYLKDWGIDTKEI